MICKLGTRACRLCWVIGIKHEMTFLLLHLIKKNSIKTIVLALIQKYGSKRNKERNPLSMNSCVMQGISRERQKLFFCSRIYSTHEKKVKKYKEIILKIDVEKPLGCKGKKKCNSCL